MLDAARAVGDFLTAIPAPTDSWAVIIGDLAWPLLVGYLILRFRTHLGEFANTLLSRARQDRNLRFGPFEFNRGDDVVILDRFGVGESTEPLEPEDIAIVEALYEFVADEDGVSRLKVWLAEKLDSGVTLDVFLTSPEYAIERAAAHRDVGLGG